MTTLHLDLAPSWHHPGVTYAIIRAELQREADARARLYPKRIEAGRLTQRDADRERALIAALLADVTRMASYAAPDASGTTWRLDPQLSAHPEPVEGREGFTWQDRRACLHRELDMRARFYPQWIAEGRLTQPDADRRTAALEALLEVYDEGWGWPGKAADFEPVWQATRTAQSRVQQTTLAL